MDEQMLEAGEVQASPEEQAMLEQAVTLAIDIIHAEGKAGDNIASMVLEAQQIQQGIGQAVATVIITVEKKMQITDDVKLPLAEEVTDELLQLAIASGALAEDEVNDQMVDAIVSHSVSAYLAMKEQLGELNQDELSANVQEAQGFMDQQKQPAAPAKPQGGLMQRAAMGA